MEAVLRRDDWLRRMARGLAGQDDGAEDLAQEAWVAGLQGVTRAREEQPWLVGAMRNIAARSIRRRQIERDHLQLLVREKPADASDDGAEQSRRELQRTVAEELLDLPHEQRELVHLVYFAGYSVEEASARVGVARSTGYCRLDAALETLRTRLDRRSGGRREVWLSSLAPFLGREAPPAASLVSGVSFAWPQALLVTLAIVVVAGGMLLWRTASASPPAVEPEVAGMLSTRKDPPTPPEEAFGRQASVRVPVDVPAEPQDSPKARVSGLFLLPGGTPAKGARWALRGWAAGPDRVARFGSPKDWKDLTGSLDADGRLDLRFPSHRSFQFALDLEIEGCAKASWRFFEIGLDEEKFLGNVELEPEAVLVGRVIGPDGPLDPEAATILQVWEEGWDARTERAAVQATQVLEAGQDRFEIHGIPPGEVRVEVRRAGGGEVHTFPLVLEAGRSNEHDLTLKRLELPAAVRVRLDAAPFPLVGRLRAEHVKAYDEDGGALPIEISRGGSGLVTVEPGASRGVRVEIFDPRFEEWVSDLMAPGTRTVARLVGAARLELSVLGPDGAPMEDVKVLARRSGRSSTPTVLHEGGVLEPPLEVAMIPGTYDLFVESVGLSGMLESVEVEGTTAAEVHLAALAALTGVVRYPDGSPAVGTEAHLLALATNGDSRATFISFSRSGFAERAMRTPVDSGAVDAEGRFSLEGAAGTRYAVVVRHPAGTWVLTDPLQLVEQNDPLALTLDRGTMLDGTVDLPAHLEGLEFGVHVVWEGWRADLDERMASPTLDTNGTFKLQGLRPGRAKVYLMPPSAEFRLAGPGGHLPGGLYVGTVELEEGVLQRENFAFQEAVPSLVSVTCDMEHLDAPGPLTSLWLQATAEQGPMRLSSRSGGSFAAEVLAPVPHEVVAIGEGWAFAPDEPLVVPAGATVEVPVEVTLERRRVRFERGGKPLDGGAVMLKFGPRRRARFPIDAGGHADIALNEAIFKVTVSARGVRRGFDLAWPPTSDVIDLGD